MCAQWGEVAPILLWHKLQQKLDLHVIERVVRELAPHGLRYVDLEGETFLHPELLRSSGC